jgi:hypothetical protein
MIGFGCFPKETIFKCGKERNLFCDAPTLERVAWLVPR